jgi:hypothetical protein
MKGNRYSKKRGEDKQKLSGCFRTVKYIWGNYVTYLNNNITIIA